MFILLLFFVFRSKLASAPRQSLSMDCAVAYRDEVGSAVVDYSGKRRHVVRLPDIAVHRDVGGGGGAQIQQAAAATAASDPCHQCHRNGNHLRAPGRGASGGGSGGGDRLTLTQLSQQRSTTSGECSFDLELGASATKVNQRLQDRYNKLTRVAAGWLFLQ